MNLRLDTSYLSQGVSRQDKESDTPTQGHKMSRLCKGILPRGSNKESSVETQGISVRERILCLYTASKLHGELRRGPQMRAKRALGVSQLWGQYCRIIVCGVVGHYV